MSSCSYAARQQLEQTHIQLFAPARVTATAEEARLVCGTMYRCATFRHILRSCPPVDDSGAANRRPFARQTSAKHDELRETTLTRAYLELLRGHARFKDMHVARIFNRCTESRGLHYLLLEAMLILAQPSHRLRRRGSILAPLLQRVEAPNGHVIDAGEPAPNQHSDIARPCHLLLHGNVSSVRCR